MKSAASESKAVEEKKEEKKEEPSDLFYGK